MAEITITCPHCDGPAKRRTAEHNANYDDVKDVPSWASWLVYTRQHGGPVVCFHCASKERREPRHIGTWMPDGDGFIFTPFKDQE